MTKKKRPEDLLPRGRPRTPRPPKRPRAQSPFLAAAARAQLPANAAPLLVWDAMQHLELVARPQDNPAAAAAAPASYLEARAEELLTIVSVHLDGLKHHIHEDQAAAAHRVAAAFAEFDIKPHARNSRRSMRADWRHWAMYCALQDVVAMPIDVLDLMRFFDALIAAGYQRATLEHLMFTLNWASKLWACPSPTEGLIFEGYWRDRCREALVKDQHQAAAFSIEMLDALEAATAQDDARSLRDLAFVSVAYDLLARASEMVAIEWDAIKARNDGGADYKIGRAKTDQEGLGANTYLTSDTMRRLRQWNAHRDPHCKFAFHALPHTAAPQPDTLDPLGVREASRIFERVGRRLGVELRLSSHSARVGAAQDMTRAGMELPAIMQAGRWKSPTMPARYAAKEIASRAGKNRAAALRKLRAKP